MALMLHVYNSLVISAASSLLHIAEIYLIVEYSFMSTTHPSSGSKWRAIFASLCAVLIFSAALVVTLNDVRKPSLQGIIGNAPVTIANATDSTICSSSSDPQHDHQHGHPCRHLCGLCQTTAVNDQPGVVPVSLGDLVETLVPVNDPIRIVANIEDVRILSSEGWINSWSATAPPVGRYFI